MEVVVLSPFASFRLNSVSGKSSRGVRHLTDDEESGGASVCVTPLGGERLLITPLVIVGMEPGCAGFALR
jgi:hypothetical protein